jgi:hypothetical protein
MIPQVRATQCELLAKNLRAIGLGVLRSGQHVDVPWSNDINPRTLHQLTAKDILDDAQDFDRIAKKLRKVYS